MFTEIQPTGVDQIMALLKSFRADERKDKVNLVVGVYADDNGNVPVLHVVKQAEKRLLQSEKTKNYVGIAGDPDLRKINPALLLGNEAKQIAEGRVVSVHTPGGTAALRVGADLISHILGKDSSVWVSNPTWANHIPVIKAAGLTPKVFPYFSESSRSLDFDGMMSSLQQHAKPKDVLLLHACCHNPTGIDLSAEQWSILCDFILERNLFPYIDCAYQGFGRGLEEDVAGLRHIASRVPEMLIANSFSKNFGIYRERCGGLTAMASTEKDALKTLGAMEGIIRSNYSMPPSHGAQIVSEIIHDKELHSCWIQELQEMRERVMNVRTSLRKNLEQRQVTEDISFLTDQIGMFSYTGFHAEQVARLREEFGIYTAADGRINVAGISSKNIDIVANGFSHVLAMS